MGSGNATEHGIKREWMEVFLAMKFSKPEIFQLHDIYNKVDIDGSGSIEVSELLDFLNIERSLFTERIFAAFDKDGTGMIDFYEFVASLWKFCALGSEAISKCRCICADMNKTIVTNGSFVLFFWFFFCFYRCILF